MTYEFANIENDLTILKRGDQVIIRDSDYEKFSLHQAIEDRLRAQARKVRGRYGQRPMNDDYKMPILVTIHNQDSSESNAERRKRSRMT